MSEREEVRRTRSKKKKRKKISLKTNGYRIKKNGYRIATSIKNKKYARDKFLLFPTTSIQIFTPHWVLKGHSCFNKSYFATFYNCFTKNSSTKLQLLLSLNNVNRHTARNINTFAPLYTQISSKHVLLQIITTYWQKLTKNYVKILIRDDR